MSASMGRVRRWSTRRHAPDLRLTEAELDALPLGTVRSWSLDGIAVRATKHREGRFLLHTRTVALPDLAGRPSRECVERT